jgi:hypothetical protein
MLVPNCIFRANGAAMLLTNKASEASRSKYYLKHLVRVNMAGSDKGYTCVYQTEDDMGGVPRARAARGCAAPPLAPPRPGGGAVAAHLRERGGAKGWAGAPALQARAAPCWTAP